MNSIKKLWQGIRADQKTVREFGFILSGFFLLVPFLVGVIKAFFAHVPFHYWWGWFLLSAVAAGTNLFFPSWTALIYRLAMVFAHGISWVMMRVILGILFYAVLTPIGVVIRLGGKDPLDRKVDRSRATYWHKRSPPPSRERYERLF